MSDEREVEQTAPEAEEVTRAPNERKGQAELADLFLREDDPRPRQYAIIATCALFIVLFLVTFPKGKGLEFDEETIYVPDIEAYIPPVKDKPPPPPERKELEKIQKVALPDPTPEEPEPIREPIPEPEPEPLPANARIMRGMPKGPPMKSGPVREGMAGLVNPQVIHAVEPDYPLIARKAGVGGTVIIQAIIDKNGNVSKAQLLKGLERFSLDENALEAVKQRRYTPGMLEGRPVEVIMTIRVEYFIKS